MHQTEPVEFVRWLHNRREFYGEPWHISSGSKRIGRGLPRNFFSGIGLICLLLLSGCTQGAGIFECLFRDATCEVPTDPNLVMNYRDPVEGEKALRDHASLSPYAKVYELGPGETLVASQLAMKVSLDPSRENEDQRNSILFECGMHPNEWYASEVCYWLIFYLSTNAREPEVRELLEYADVWVIPQSNPEGRLVTDLNGGTPTAGNWNPGRGNANNSTCPGGVNLARNFSVDWGSAPNICGNNYRGPTTFSERESRNLRRFIHNRMIGTVVVVHGAAQSIHRTWGNSNSNQWVLDRLAQVNRDGHAAGPGVTPPYLTELAVSSSRPITQGQFSARTAQPSPTCTTFSDNPCPPGTDTRRSIATYFIELPIKSSIYEGQFYAGRSFQQTIGDGSGGSLPSGPVVAKLWRDTLLPVFTELVRQARSPQCPIDEFSNRVTVECEQESFGLVGAKIGDSIDQPGSLTFSGANGQELVVANPRQIFVAIQNFSANSANQDVRLQVRVDRRDVPAAGTSGAIIQDAVYNSIHTVPVGDRAVVSVPYTFDAGKEYWVRISLVVSSSESISNDNRKVFRFLAK